MSKLNVDQKTIKDLFQSKKSDFLIPDYQRPYACGSPQYEEENIEEYVSLPTAIFGKGDFFILRASGQSMIEAGIDDGDLVVVKKQVEAKEGDIVVALVDNQNTLKRYFRDDENKKIILHPENKKMKDIIVDKCCIQGVACHIIKEL